MPTRSQRHMREIRGEDSSGRGPDALPIGLTFAVSPSSASITHPDTQVFTVTATDDGVPVEGLTLTGVMEDVAIATVGAVSGATDSSGQATFTVTSVYPGTTRLVVDAAGSARPTYVPVTIPAFATVVLSEDSVGGNIAITHPNTQAIIANLLGNSVAIIGKDINAASDDELVATVAPATDQTDASGNVTFTVTSVAAGTANITITSPEGGDPQVVICTVT